MSYAELKKVLGEFYPKQAEDILSEIKKRFSLNPLFSFCDSCNEQFTEGQEVHYNDSYGPAFNIEYCSKCSNNQDLKGFSLKVIREEAEIQILINTVIATIYYPELTSMEATEV